MRGDVCVGGFPDADTLHLALNSALRLRTIDGRSPVLIHQRTESGGATTVYSIVRPGRDGTLQEPLCVRYEGSERVYEIAREHYRVTDESSLLAFNGRTFRARGAARWLPTPFDARIGLAQEAATYQLQIRCAACSTLFMNGADPASGPVAEFRAIAPREPLLIAGDLRVADLGALRVLAEREVSTTGAERLVAEMEAIRAFFEEHVGVPYGPLPDLGLLSPVRAPRRGQLWGFFSDPSLTLLGMDLEQLLETLQTGRPRARRALRAFLAHEMAHRYFGWRLGTESSQRDLFGEPFATFLELKAIRHFQGEENYRAAVLSMQEQLREMPALPSLASAGPEEFSYAGYRYAYAPLVLLSLERMMGETEFNLMLRDLLSLPASHKAAANFALLRELALKHGVRAERWEDWVRRCLDREELVQQCGSFNAASKTTELQ